MIGTDFTVKVKSSIDLNIPKEFAEANDIQEGDTVTVRIVSHARDGEVIYSEEQQ